MANTRRDARRVRRADAEASLKLVRVRWRDGRASSDDVMWARSVSDLVAAAPVHLAMKYFRAWEDVVLGSYSEQGADRVRRDAESRGHAVELLTTSDYTAAYVASELGCPAIADDELRITFRPSFHPEGVVTARRTPDAWEVETRISRESIWYTRFSAAPFALWIDLVRSPGIDVHVKKVPREAVAEAERLLCASAQHPNEESRIGADGITVHVSSRLAGAAFEQEAWCPEPGTRARAAADLALLLASAASPPEWPRAVARYLG